MLCDLNTILKIADSRHYAAAAFNIFGYEDARAVVDAAEALQKPVILMTNKDAVAHMPYAVLSGICTYCLLYTSHSWPWLLMRMILRKPSSHRPSITAMIVSTTTSWGRITVPGIPMW